MDNIAAQEPEETQPILEKQCESIESKIKVYAQKLREKNYDGQYFYKIWERNSLLARRINKELSIQQKVFLINSLVQFNQKQPFFYLFYKDNIHSCYTLLKEQKQEACRLLMNKKVLAVDQEKQADTPACVELVGNGLLQTQQNEPIIKNSVTKKFN